MGMYSDPNFRQLLYREESDEYRVVKEPGDVDPLKAEGWRVVTRDKHHEARFASKPKPEG